MNKYEKDNMHSVNFEFFYKDNIPNTDHLLHYHDFLEVYFHLEGDCDYIIDSRIYTLQKGDIVIINSNKLHRAIIKDMTKKLLRYVLWIEYEYINQLIGDYVQVEKTIGHESKIEILRLPHNKCEYIKQLFKSLNEELQEDDFLQPIIIQSYLSQLLLMLCRYSTNKYQIKEESIKNDTMVQAIMEYIDQHYQQEIVLDDLAEHFFMNKYYLMKRFKKHTDMTIMDYCKKKRLIVARTYLLQGKSIQDIYKLCGFEDYSNFFRAFKSVYNMSPREYKKFMLKNHNKTLQIEIENNAKNKNN